MPLRNIQKNHSQFSLFPHTAGAHSGTPNIRLHPYRYYHNPHRDCKHHDSVTCLTSPEQQPMSGERRTRHVGLPESLTNPTPCNTGMSILASPPYHAISNVTIQHPIEIRCAHRGLHCATLQAPLCYSAPPKAALHSREGPGLAK
jgi:hypothetical protein